MAAEDSLSSYLEVLYSDCDGLVQLVCKRCGFGSPEYFTTDDLTTAGEWGARHAAQCTAQHGKYSAAKPGGDVYLRMTTMAGEAAPKHRGGIELTKEVVSLSLDIDFRTDYRPDLDGVLPTCLDDVLPLLRQFPLPMSLMIDSGGGVYPFWLLDEPIEDGVEEVLARWRSYWLDVFAEAGYHLDDGFDSAHLARPPGTINHKGGHNRPVHVLEGRGDVARYSVEEIGALLPALPSRAEVAAPSTPDADDPYDDLRLRGPDGHRFVAERLEARGWQILSTSDESWAEVSLLRPENSIGPPTSGLSLVIGGPEDHFAGMCELFSSSVVNPDGGLVSTGSYQLGELLTAVCFSGNRAACKQWLRSEGFGQPKSAEGSAMAEWPTPTRIDTIFRPAMPIEVLPIALAEAIEHIADTRLVRPDLVWCGYAAAIAGVLAEYVEMAVSPTWKTPINLYTMPIIESGGGKSPGLAPARDLARQISDHREERFAPHAARARVELSVAEAAMKETKKNPNPDFDTLTDLQIKIERLEQAAAQQGRFVTGDTTPEALTDLMAGNGGIGVMIDDEGTIIQHVLGMYSNRPNLDILLKGWDGTDYDSRRRGSSGRVGGPIHITSPRVSICAAIQPVVWNDAVDKQLVAQRGMLARFLISFPAPLTGRRVLDALTEDDDAPVDRLNLLVMKVWEDLRNAPVTLVLGDEARTAFEQWHNEVEVTLLDRSDDYAMVASKVRGMVPRLAALFHLLDEIEGAEVGVKHAVAAIEVGEYHLAHATAAAQHCDGAVIRDARKIARKLTPHPNETMTVRDIVHASGFKNATGGTARVIKALELLSDHDWVTPADQSVGFASSGRKIGKASPGVLISPHIGQWKEG